MSDSTTRVELTQQLQTELGDAAEQVRDDYESLYNWMTKRGKNVKRAKGLKAKTAENYIERLDQLHRFMLRYTDTTDHTTISKEDAEKLMHLIDEGVIAPQRGRNKGDEYAEDAKRKFENTLQKYFEWRSHIAATDSGWDSGLTFTDGNQRSADSFSQEELGLIFSEAESYRSLPSYDTASEQERKKINGLVAQRLRIPKKEVTRKDWLRANKSTHVSSLVKVGYDAGLSPKEIAAAEIDWYYPRRQVLQIPTKHACKQRNKEEVVLSNDAAEVLSKWTRERRHLEKYDGTAKIWLNREGNPYESGSLCRLLRRLCKEAGINIEGRKIVWYSLRETLGKYMKSNGGIFEANDQLRHETLASTKRYGDTPIEGRRDSLNTIHDSAKQAAENSGTDQHEKSVMRPVEQTSASEPVDEVITPTDSKTIHIDTEIKDTPENRIDVSTKILDQDGED